MNVFADIFSSCRLGRQLEGKVKTRQSAGEEHVTAQNEILFIRW